MLMRPFTENVSGRAFVFIPISVNTVQGIALSICAVFPQFLHFSGLTHTVTQRCRPMDGSCGNIVKMKGKKQ